MKERVIVFESSFSSPDEITFGAVKATPVSLLKRILTGKRFSIKYGELSIKRDCSIEEQLPRITEQLKVLLEKL